MDIVAPRIEEYLLRLFDEDHPVAAAMEARAAEHDFPIIGRLVGITLELLARAIGARRVLEMGSGFGYSAYWFSRAVGPGGEIHMTEGEEENLTLAMEYLGRADLADRVIPHAGEALEILDGVEGQFDVIFCDIDKGDYPAAWRAARDRVRTGGLYVCDNVLWSGRVVEDQVTDDVEPGWTDRVKEHNEMVARDEGYRSMILPTRDGVLVALRVA